MDEQRIPRNSLLPAAGGLFTPTDGTRAGFLAVCANSACRSSWLRLWRSRNVPMFEGGWTCSPECTIARMYGAVLREIEIHPDSGEHRHRVPLGLLMMERGWISREQLRRALQAQRTAGSGRIGYWLIRQNAATEETITRALALQWSCPVLGAEPHQIAALAPWIPRLIVDAFGVLPVRLVSAKVLYLGFVERLDLALALAVERMSGLRIECCVVPESQFRPAHAHILQEPFPSTELVEAVSPYAAARALAKSIERVRPVAAQLVRVHDCLWMRMWLRQQPPCSPGVDVVQDILCSIGPGIRDAAPVR
jgi:hypothetical protein